MRLTRICAATLAATIFAAGCSDSTEPGPKPVIGVTVTAVGPSTIRVTFTGRKGESYDLERASGATGAFASVHTFATLNAAGQQTYDDTGLDLHAAYRYRVVTVRGGSRSEPSAEAGTTTGSVSVQITSDITSNRTLYADTVYTLKGFIHVLNGATLTIQAGTLIQGDYETLGSSLFIMRGARIQAVGTAANPIVFTSSRAPGQRQPGDWGGLIIVGNAPINRSGTIEVEGTNTNVNNNYQVVYSGGNTSTDNSGTLSYVRVEFGGYAPSLNNELNSFTFAAVGSGTRASYLQAIAGLDDSFEWFGGGFDMDHLVAYESGDDMFDMSEGFAGRMQYLIGINTTVLTPRTGSGSPASDPQGIENDGCNGAGCDLGFNSTPLTIPVVANFTLVGTGSTATSGSSGGIGMMLRRGAGGYYVNGVVARFPRFGVSLRDAETYVRAGSAAIPNLATADLAVRNVLFSEVPVVFEPAGSSVQNSFDLAGNGLINSATAAASLLTALPAAGGIPSGVSAFDWTPAAGSAIASGGLTTFPGKLLTAAGSFVVPTSYLGAADPAGAKWWAGWTVYNRN
jgi:hypothetical protein